MIEPSSSPNTVVHLLKKLWPAIRILLSALLLARAVSQIDWANLEVALPQLNAYWLLLAMALSVMGNMIAGLRWGYLMKIGGFHRKMRHFIMLYFTGSLINQGLPSTIGGDSYRALVVIRDHQTFDRSKDFSLNQAPPRFRKSFFIVGLDRTLGLAGNCLLGAIGLILGGAVINNWASELGALLTIGMLIGALGIALGLRLHFTQKYYRVFMHKLGLDEILSVSNAAWGFPNIFIQLPVAILIHILALATFWACLKACGISAPLDALMIGMPALGLILMLPISISGWGLREATLSGMLALWGLNPSLVVLSSILYGVITLITYLPGFPLLLKRRTHIRS